MLFVFYLLPFFLFFFFPSCLLLVAFSFIGYVSKYLAVQERRYFDDLRMKPVLWSS